MYLDKKDVIHIGWKKIYQYKGFIFEFHDCYGPVRLRKSDLRESIYSGKNFYYTINEWEKLSKIEKEKTKYENSK